MLFREYAIDPKVMTDWETAKAIYEGMGAHLGRMWNPVWEPTGWNSTVRALVEDAVSAEQLKPVQGQAIKSKHLSHLRTAIWPACPAISCETPWSDAAARCHVNHPFHAIVSPSHIRDHPMLVPGNISNHDLRWEPGPSVSTNRDASDFVKAVDGILRASTQLVFIDPYFAKKMGNSAMKTPMLAYCRLACAGDIKRSRSPTQIEIHTERKNLPDAWISTQWRDFVELALLPTRPTLVLWDDGTLHNRFILGNSCGVSFGHGLDTGASGDARREIISRLSEASRKEHWDTHVNKTAEWRRTAPARIL